MKKMLLFVALVAITAGCSNPIKKSISEELSLEEIKSISKKDPLFLAFYDRYFENKCYEHFLTDKTVQVMYSDITYKRYYEYIKQINDDDFINAVYEEAEKEWNEEFGYTEQKFDSIINYWQNYFQENAPKTYLDVEFDHAVTYSYYSMRGVKLFFKLTPKRGKLSRAEFWYTIKTNENENIVMSGIARQIHAFSNSTIMVEDSYSSNDEFYKDVNRLSNEKLKEKYSFNFVIDKVKTDEDVYIDIQGLYQDMPIEVNLYIKELNGVFGEGADIDNIINKDKATIIKRYIDEDYVSLDEFKTMLQNMRMEKIDPMCYNFQKFIVDCKKSL